MELETSAGGIDKETLINTVREEISERNDIIRRKHNLVVFNIKELSSEFQNDRAVHDKTAVLDFFNTVLHKDQAIVESDFTNVFRIGKTVEGASNKGPRPIIVVMKSVNVKYSVLKSYSAKRAKKWNLTIKCLSYLIEHQLRGNRTGRESNQRRPREVILVIHLTLILSQTLL